MTIMMKTLSIFKIFVMSGIWSTPTKGTHVILTIRFNLTSAFLQLSPKNDKTPNLMPCAIVQSSAITRMVHVIFNTTINLCHTTQFPVATVIIGWMESTLNFMDMYILSCLTCYNVIIIVENQTRINSTK